MIILLGLAIEAAELLPPSLPAEESPPVLIFICLALDQARWFFGIELSIITIAIYFLLY